MKYVKCTKQDFSREWSVELFLIIVPNRTVSLLSIFLLYQLLININRWTWEGSFKSSKNRFLCFNLKLVS